MPARMLKKIVYWCMGLVLTLLVAASVAVSVIDWNQYRETLSTLVSNQIGMRVDIGGRISAGLFPRPNVITESVRLYPETDFGAPQVATANRIEIRLGVSALLKGELAIQHLGFDGLDVTLDETEDGGWQVRGWPQNTASPDEGEPSSIALDKLKVIGSTVSLVERSGIQRRLEGLSLDLSGSLPDGPMEWVGAFRLAGVQVETDGRMRPATDRQAYSVKTDITLEGGSMVISGRLENGGFAGRLRAQGPSLATFASAAATLGQNRQALVAVPGQPFDFDLQVDRDSSLYRLTTRALQVGESRGRLDVTVAARGGGFHTAGTVSLGVIDAAPWLAAAQQKEDSAQAVPITEGQPQGEVALPTQSAPVTGTIDVAVEGISISGGMIQQIDAVVALGGDGPALTNLQALLPGGTGLSLDGRVSAQDGEAAVHLVAANLPEFLRWVGIDVSSRIPAGRLATAELRGLLTLDDAAWRLGDIDARVDTSNITGDIAGVASQAWPTSVVIEADSLNLDAYLTPSEDGGEAPRLFDGLPETALHFQILADRIQWGGNQFKGLVARGQLDRQQAQLEHLEVSQGGGALEMAASATPHASGLAVETQIRLEDWSFPGVRSVVADTGPYYRALKLGRMDGTLSLSGPLDTLLVSAAIERDEHRRMNLSGTVSAPGYALTSVSLQGQFLHDDLGPALRLQGLAPGGAVPADLSFTINQTMGDSTNIGVSGSIAGGQIRATGGMTANQQTLDMTFDHARAGEFLALAGAIGGLPNPDRAMRASAKLTADDSGWTLDPLDIRNGDARLTGRLSADAGKRLSGELTAAGLAFAADTLTAGGTSNGQQRAALAIEPALFDYSGDVAVSLESLVIAGQRIEAPAAQLLSGDGVMRFNLGNGATVNGAPSELSVDLSGPNAPTLRGRAVVPALNIGDMLLSGGLRQAVSGTAGLAVDFDSSGSTVQEILRSLKGRATIDGKAGVLNFLSVPQLVQSMNQATSSSSFLGGIGTLLRSGTTNFSSFGASVTVDAGTALIEKVEAQGPWGTLALDGQVNLIDRLMNLQGQLALTAPPDAPVIPVRYAGSLDNPSSEWTSRALERFVIAGIERRLRATLLRDLDTAQGEEGASNPGAAVFSRALGLLGVLRQQQQEKKAAEEAATTADQPSQ